jgi:CheY-like chemotaxis protein
VCTFYDGLSALEHAQEEIPDIVLSDVIMPKMNGIVLARKLREQLPNCRILLISGNTYSATLLAEWQDQGGPELEILPKPVSPQTILRKLSTIAAAMDADSDSHK